MALKVSMIAYHHIVADDQTSQAVRVVSAFRRAGVNLLAFSEFPHSPGKSQLDLIAEDAEFLEATAADLGFDLGERRSGFLIEGDGQPGAAVTILEQLAAAHIKVTAMQSISAGAGRFGSLLWVRPAEVEKAAMVLRAAVLPPRDTVDEASEESFPASDPPAWLLAPVRLT